MPEATPTPPPWERGQGHDGCPERPETHARFRAWLELGPSRNLATYAAVLGVSKQSLSETAARFKWRQRAAASDAHLLVLSDYRRAMEPLGRSMAEEAEAVLVTRLREDMTEEIERRRSLATSEDHAAAAEATQGAAQIVMMVARLVAAVTSLAAASRQHWGDEVGVHKILGEGFVARKDDP